MSAPRILVLAAHPALQHSHVNRPMIEAARGLAHVELRDLYALYPDYAIDVAAEQAAAAAADLIVWQHPWQWYSMPPLMKLWLDEVLAHGWAYGHDAQGRATRALAGKDLWLATSTGGAESAYHPGGYNRHFFDAFLPPLEQTAALCGLRFLPPLVLHGAHAVDEAGIAAHAALFAQRLSGYPDWPELADLPACETCITPDQDRPAPGDALATGARA